MNQRHRNQLSTESSPYLLQHADNPVNWYPWSDEAFELAKKEDKPVFLSIGYATCHWCHVMEHESFEDPAVANLLNEHFVAVKVDREERPDIDAVYMAVTQALTGSGGWPMTVIMTPEKEPFLAGTYFPKEGRYGRPGMLELLPTIAKAWKDDRKAIVKSTKQILEALKDMSEHKQGAVGPDALKQAQQQFVRSFDSRHGGFGRAPKFPSPHNLMFLLRRYHETGNEQLLNIVDRTLTQMRLGGIWDHLGHGFHRYSTDPEWLVPHFEKMLYDQGMLTFAYLEAYQLTDKALFAQTAREILTYVLRDMRSPEGGFYSAEDADSEGEEGKFYVWTADEIRNVLGNRADAFIAEYGIEDDGNFRDEATRTKTGANILHLDHVPEAGSFADERQALFEHREKRVHPLKDDKILTDWNGLMIAAVARAARVLGDDDYLQAATDATDFVLRELRRDDGRYYKRYRNGKVGLHGHIDDYAFMLWGLIELYEAGFEPRYLAEARRTADLMIELFEDEKNGAFFLTADNAEKLLVRTRETYDGASPSGNSVAALNLQRLAHLTGNMDYRETARRALAAVAGTINQAPFGHTCSLMAVQFSLAPVHELVVVGRAADRTRVQEALAKPFLPHTVVLWKDSDDLSAAVPFVADHEMIEAKTTFYVCSKFTCDQPTTDLDEVLRKLK